MSDPRPAIAIGPFASELRFTGGSSIELTPRAGHVGRMLDSLHITAAERQRSSGMWRIIILEFWERFSYYGILAILALFLTSPTEQGGLAWSDSRALNLLATFTAVAFILPMLGGYAADRWLGARLAVFIGGSLLVVGNALIAASALKSPLAPYQIDLATAERVLYAGLAAVAVGNGFFKSSLVTVLGKLAPDDSAKRDRAFRYYYQAVMIGALAAALSVGAAAQAAGWWSGFALAAAGMGVAWVMFVTWRPAPDIVDALNRKTRVAAAGDSHRDRTVSVRLDGHGVSIAILCAFLVLITVGWVQLHGLWLLEFERRGDRTIGDLTIPSAWLLAVNGIGVALFSPVVGDLWRRIVKTGWLRPGFVPQFVTAFAVMGIAHVAMAYGFHDAAPGSVPLAWPLLCALTITFAELIFWPSSYNCIHQLAPTRAKSTLMGVWLAMLGIGQFFSHQIARAADDLGFSRLSAFIGAAMLVGGLALWVISRVRPQMREL